MAAKRVFEGLTVVAVGLILLANTTGLLPWTVWWTILSLWPLLLVSAGIDILGRATNSTALRVLASLVVIGGLAFGVAATTGAVSVPGFGPRASGGEAFNASEPASGATTGRAEIGVGMARVTLDHGPSLVSVEGRTPFGAPRVRTTSEGDVANVDVDMGDGTRIFPMPRTDSFLDVKLSDELEWERVKVDGGMSDLDLDVSELDVRRLEVNVGMSSATVTFGTVRDEASAELSGGMSSFRLRVPDGLGVELVSDNGLGSVSVPDGWQRVGGDGPFQGTWKSDGYDSAASKLRLVVKTGLSSVDVVRY